MHDYYRIAEALKYIGDHQQAQPKLDQVAEQIHLSPFHFQRLFSEWAGVSPKKFLQYLSLENAKKVLKDQSASVYDAAFEAGLSGTGRLHDLFVNIEGMTPGQYKNGGENLTIQYSLQECQFGNYLIASTQTGVCNLLFFDKIAGPVIEELRALWPKARLIEAQGAYDKQVDQFFKGALDHRQPIRLHLKGTDFQLKVWEALLKIPEASLTHYTGIADLIDHKNAHRAVGTAIGRNPIAFLIPCHRVIKSVGKIGEYRWGSQRKAAIIGWEQAKNDQNVEA